LSKCLKRKSNLIRRKLWEKDQQVKVEAVVPGIAAQRFKVQRKLHHAILNHQSQNKNRNYKSFAKNQIGKIF
jgi:hypothetical protein